MTTSFHILHISSVIKVTMRTVTSRGDLQCNVGFRQQWSYPPHSKMPSLHRGVGFILPSQIHNQIQLGTEPTDL